MQHPLERQLLRFNNAAGQPAVLLAAAPILWSVLWLIVGIQFRRISTITGWLDAVLSPTMALWIVIPITAYLIIFSKSINAKTLFAGAAFCYACLAATVLLLSSWNGFLTCLILGAVFHLASFLGNEAAFDLNRIKIGEQNSTTETQCLPRTQTEDSLMPVPPVPPEPLPLQTDGLRSRMNAAPPEGITESSFDEADGDEEDFDEAEEINSADWIQQQTWRRSEATEGSAFELEWFGRHQWNIEKSTVECHVLFQPAFIQLPEIHVELIEGEGRIRMVEQQPHGVRLELKRGSEAEDSTAVIWLKAIGGIVAPFE